MQMASQLKTSIDESSKTYNPHPYVYVHCCPLNDWCRQLEIGMEQRRLNGQIVEFNLPIDCKQQPDWIVMFGVGNLKPSTVTTVYGMRKEGQPATKWVFNVRHTKDQILAMLFVEKCRHIVTDISECKVCV